MPVIAISDFKLVRYNRGLKELSNCSKLSVSSPAGSSIAQVQAGQERFRKQPLQQAVELVSRSGRVKTDPQRWSLSRYPVSP